MLTSDQLNQVRSIASTGGVPSNAPLSDDDSYNQWKQSLTTQAQPPASHPLSSALGAVAGATSSAFHGGLDQIHQGADQIAHGGGPLGGAVAGAEGALKIGSGIASAVTSPLAIIGKPIQAGVNAAGNIS